MRLYRLHMKTNAKDRKALVDYCLTNKQLPIGWSGLHKDFPNLAEGSGQDLAEAFQKTEGKSKRPLKAFANLQKDDLVWTRDLNGIYYLCRVCDAPVAQYIPDLDIGATVSVEIHKVGTSVPGNIMTRFSRKGAAIEAIMDDDILRYSQSLYNTFAGKQYYQVASDKYHDLFMALPPLDLEELVIDYLQIKYDYYLSKNSVAKQDTTIKVECELFPKSGDGKPAVVQVKNNDSRPQSDYLDYVKEGKKVFLFFANENYGDVKYDDIICIPRKVIEQFAFENTHLLPPSIQKWVAMCRRPE